MDCGEDRLRRTPMKLHTGGDIPEMTLWDMRDGALTQLVGETVTGITLTEEHRRRS